MKKLLTLFTIILLIGVLVACGGGSKPSTSSDGGDNQVGTAEEKKELKIGATAGPYSDMITTAIKPILEEQGYTIEVVEFSDYIQPNLALGNGSLDANLFQHLIYMENFAKDNNLELSDLIIVPTVPMGVYSNKHDSLDNIQEGSTITIPNDPTNLARALLILEDAGFITISEDVNPLTVSEKDIKENPKNIEFLSVEAASLPRSLESTDFAIINGNFAIASGLNLLDAIKLEVMPDDYRNRVVVNTKDIDSQFAKDIKAAVESAEFEQIIDEKFQGYDKPEWMRNR